LGGAHQLLALAEEFFCIIGALGIADLAGFAAPQLAGLVIAAALVIAISIAALAADKGAALDLRPAVDPATMALSAGAANSRQPEPSHCNSLKIRTAPPQARSRVRLVRPHNSRIYDMFFQRHH
jgi:hypothetical protein